MTDAPQQARQDDLQAIIDALVVSLSTVALREGLANELRGLAGAQTREALSLGYGRASGWAAALYQASLIGPETFEAFDAARVAVRRQALARIQAHL